MKKSNLKRLLPVFALVGVLALAMIYNFKDISGSQMGESIPHQQETASPEEKAEIERQFEENKSLQDQKIASGEYQNDTVGLNESITFKQDASEDPQVGEYGGLFSGSFSVSVNSVRTYKTLEDLKKGESGSLSDYCIHEIEKDSSDLVDPNPSDGSVALVLNVALNLDNASFNKNESGRFLATVLGLRTLDSLPTKNLSTSIIFPRTIDIPNIEKDKLAQRGYASYSKGQPLDLKYIYIVRQSDYDKGLYLCMMSKYRIQGIKVTP